MPERDRHASERTAFAANASLTIKALILFLDVVTIIGLSTARTLFGIGICMFVSIFTLIAEGILVAVDLSQWQNEIAQLQVFQSAMPGTSVQWKHIQFSCSLVLGSFNFTSLLMITGMSQRINSGSFFIPGLTTFAIVLLFVAEALAALRLNVSSDANDYVQI